MIALSIYGYDHTWLKDWLTTLSLGTRASMLVALLAATALFIFLAKRWVDGGSNGSERKVGTRLGIIVSDVERDLPRFTRGNKSCQLVRGSCVRYSLPRYGESGRAAWSLLQRTESDGAQFPNGYLLQGEASDALRQVLTKLATEFSEEYFEFEGTASDVAIYWLEWGGASQVERIQRILQSVAGL